MSYSSGMLNYKVAILKKKDAAEKKFGARQDYEQVACVHADITWKKGQRACKISAV